VTLRYRSKLLHIGVGRVHAGVRVLLLVNDLGVRVITEDGELLRRRRRPQPLGAVQQRVTVPRCGREGLYDVVGDV
jgi:hypothetical protein